jgi:LPS O-antigen subunit length determinant protein (WzzB/FepE family)
MPDIFDVITRWWKYIFVILLLTIAAVGAIVFLKPKKYLAIATALPAPSYASDKAAIFGENIQVLYPNIGIPDDLDKIVGTALLDTVYYSVVDQYHVIAYYKLENDGEGRQKAVSRLKSNTRVIKSDYGELKVKVWDQDRNQSALFANAIMEALRLIHQEIENANNSEILEKIKNEYDIKKAKWLALIDSAKINQLLLIKQEALLKQLVEYEKLIGEYELMTRLKPQALIIVEKARPPLWPDRPRRLQIIIAAAILSFIFSILMILMLERRKVQPA